MSELTGWDLAVILIGLVSVVMGVWRGLIRTVFALAAWVGGLVAVPMFGPAAVDSLGLGANVWFAYLLVFLAAFIGIRLLGRLIARGARSAGLGGADRLFGAVLGLIRALAIFAVIAVLAKQAGLHESSSWKLSYSRPMFEGLLSMVEPWLPESVSGIRKT